MLQSSSPEVEFITLELMAIVTRERNSIPLTCPWFVESVLDCPCPFPEPHSQGGLVPLRHNS